MLEHIEGDVLDKMEEDIKTYKKLWQNEEALRNECQVRMLKAEALLDKVRERASNVAWDEEEIGLDILKILDGKDV